ncbi:MAG: hypothetical protein H7Y88_12710 [Phycisphaerales bacterium]|nr:hypothetical protein [Phycisphaerales bacterium]
MPRPQGDRLSRFLRRAPLGGTLVALSFLCGCQGMAEGAGFMAYAAGSANTSGSCDNDAAIFLLAAVVIGAIWGGLAELMRECSRG